MNKKKLSNDQKIIAAMDAIDKSVRSLTKFSATYDGYIDEAALHNKDVRAKQLIKQKLQVIQLTEQLMYLKSNIERGVYTSRAIAELGKLPEAMAACKGLLAESPNFTKLGESITSIFTDIGKSESEIQKLNDILNPPPVETVQSRLEGTSADPIEETDQFKAEYAAMMERLKVRVAAESVVKPEDDGVAITGDIDIEGIMSSENNNKD